MCTKTYPYILFTLTLDFTLMADAIYNQSVVHSNKMSSMYREHYGQLT